MRVDLFSTVHKALRKALFDLARDLACLEVSSIEAVDRAAERVEYVLGLLDEHAAFEGAAFAAVRTLDPLLAAELDKDHRSLEIVQHDVEQLAQQMAMADRASRPGVTGRLAIAVHHLIALQLLHMNREESEANRVLWSGLDDAALVALSRTAALPPARAAEWQRLVTAATTLG